MSMNVDQEVRAVVDGIGAHTAPVGPMRVALASERCVAWDILAVAVNATRGRRGSNAVIDKSFDAPPMAKDGVTFAKRLLPAGT